MLSPEWLTAALGARYPGVRVAGATVVESRTGVASKVRFVIEYADRGDGSAPTALCAKGYFGPDGQQYGPTGQIEARFYGELAPRLDVRCPHCAYSGTDPHTGHALLLLTDLIAAGASFPTALDPYTLDRVAATLEQLARLHAADGNTFASLDTSWLASRTDGYLNAMTAERLQEQLDDGRATVLGPELRDAARVRAAFREIALRAAADPRGLIHGDTHAGNLYLTAEGAPGFLDWQLVQWGPWAIDVAYHIGAVLSVSDREAHERALLEHYLDARRQHGGAAPSLAEAWDDYRAFLAYGYYLWGITQKVDRPIIIELITRLGSAVEAHESFDRLGV